MTLLNTLQNENKVMESLRNGDTSVLKGMDATQVLAYGLAMQREYGALDTGSKISPEAVGQAIQSNLQHVKVLEENKERIRKEHMENVVRLRLQQQVAYKSY